MKITASRLRIFLSAFLLIFIVMLTNAFLFDVKLEDLISFDYLLLILGAPLLWGAIWVYFSYEDITITDTRLMSSRSIYNGFQRNGLVDKGEIDIARSQRRNLWDRLWGVYRIYNTKGKGFSFNRHYFHRRDFERLRSILAQDFGVKIN